MGQNAHAESNAYAFYINIHVVYIETNMSEDWTPYQLQGIGSTCSFVS